MTFPTEILWLWSDDPTIRYEYPATEANYINFKDYISRYGWVIIEERYTQVPNDYPKVITRGALSFNVYSSEGEIQMNDFLGISPAGLDMETYLSNLSPFQLTEWRDYWVTIWTQYKRDDMVSFVIQRYSQPPIADWAPITPTSPNTPYYAPPTAIPSTSILGGLDIKSLIPIVMIVMLIGVIK